LSKLLVVIVSSLLAVVAANAGVIGFDDLGSTCNSTNIGNVPDGYGGINWSGNWTCYSNVEAAYPPHSQPGRVFDSSTAGNFFTFVTPQTFQGAWFSGLNTTTVQFELYSGINLVGSSVVLGTTSTPTFLSSGYAGLIDKVVVASNAPDHFVMDDVTYTSGPTGPTGSIGPIETPEPKTVALLAAGLGLIALARRFRTSPYRA
jgi:hypothetical protein